MFVVITGNPVNGFTIVGPFESREDAFNSAERFDADWWISELVSLEEYEGDC